jgi:hypothetical protein
MTFIKTALYYADYHYAESLILLIVMLNVIVLSVVMLIVVGPFMGERYLMGDIDSPFCYIPGSLDTQHSDSQHNSTQYNDARY